jgi:hypothetical protein
MYLAGTGWLQNADAKTTVFKPTETCEAADVAES